MTATRNSTGAPPSAADREIVIARVLDAPRELVFEAFTDPRHIAEWWGPDGFTTTIHEMNVTVGGVWRYIMHGPDGTDYDNLTTYREIVKPERLVYSHGDSENPEMFHATVTFEAQGNKTRITLRMLAPTAVAREEMKKFGAIEGGNQTLARLDAYLAKARAR
jgi:uncharacterized protein YndB with AHSA1/START domain